ncbi:SDR family oxidoreductase [Martelella mediterranea]|uniref:3-oxoacyl-[acyl-carrier-protein] reductase FabG n=1 Tax=Martelella mediterranea DSM 17316 TaxID=1122214 RepID=A0A1U9Z4I3_9HYPH|nr:SDR family oxidoreductase [Martelella mediterranea]AQZ52576.1 3-oxoacyl-[acyl-carrier-protein] reductase FabG [Martelella mediterranea DSM 17316]
MQQNPRSRTVLVTGGAKRLGRAIVEGMANYGFNVAIHANQSIDEAESAAQALRETGIDARVFRADLLDGDQTGRLVAAVNDAMGPVDILVNNASLFEDDAASHFSADRFDRHFAIHVKAPLILSEHFARQADGGLIVNMIDQRVWALTPRFFSYTLSKSTLWTATQTMAQAFAPNIRVNAIGPGPTLKNIRQSDEDFESQIGTLILRRGPALSEFAATIRYLYETPSITGQMIALDGGQHLAWETPDVTGINE